MSPDPLFTLLLLLSLPAMLLIAAQLIAFAVFLIVFFVRLALWAARVGKHPVECSWPAISNRAALWLTALCVGSWALVITVGLMDRNLPN